MQRAYEKEYNNFNGISEALAFSFETLIQLKFLLIALASHHLGSFVIMVVKFIIWIYHVINVS